MPEKKSKWDNKNDEACGLIRMSISSDLWFHLQGIDDPDEAWEKLEPVYLVNTMRFEPTSLKIN
jgi:hypothetical protein